MMKKPLWMGGGLPAPSLNLDFTLGTLDPRITFSRGTAATRFNSAGVMETLGNTAARFDYDPVTLDPKGLLIEEQRTNSIRNNTMVGAAAGTPGTAPTNWNFGTLHGLTLQTLPVGTVNGITYIDVHYSGTTNAASFTNIDLEANTAVAATPAQVWTHSVYVALVAGSFANVNAFTLNGAAKDSGGIYISEIATATPILAGMTSTLVRKTLSGTAPALTAFVGPYMQFTYGNGVAIDFTIRIGLPQLELGAFATSVIPTSGSAATRSADVATMSVAPWYNQNEGTFFQEFNLGDAGASNVVNQTAAEYKNSAANRIVLNCLSSVTVNVIVGGATTYNPTSGTKAANKVIRSAAALRGNFNSFACSNLPNAFNGPNLASAIPSGVTDLNLGSQGGSSAFLNGWLRKVRYWPRRLTDDQLKGLTR